MVKDTQARKYQLTINNPADKGMTHDQIKMLLLGFKPLVYFCMADEVGAGEQTPHTHIYAAFSSAVRFSTIKNAFPSAHIEKCVGTSEENRAYIRKEGKWALSEKAETTVDGTFEEWGEMPHERQGQRRDLADLYEQIKNGASDFDILESNPNYIRYIGLMDKARQAVAKESVKSRFRQLTVTYIYGETGVGKTRYVMEKHGYDSVYRVTDYKHPFDNYGGQPVICFDEYADSFRIRDFLTYLDGYPLELPCRYANRWATYDTVYILSNTPLDGQYRDEQFNNPTAWRAFLRRITNVVQFLPNNDRVYYQVDTDFQIVPKDFTTSDTPFKHKIDHKRGKYPKSEVVRHKSNNQS